ncbi:hypothetical protein GCM10009799_27500 [Nocardiopsis rhodophaea]|uniref:Uncharacterized protein n=1 Tax=Nocardiopsis rhodophaea TaxID=280238 RepID=A0ABN2T714_9ACTN
MVLETNALMAFIKQGTIEGITLGCDYSRIVEEFGEAKLFASRSPVYCRYGDLELGFTQEDRLRHIGIEAAGGVAELPTGIGETKSISIPPLDELIRMIEVHVSPVVLCEPFVVGETWHRVERSGVIINGDDEGGVDAINMSVLPPRPVGG